MRLKHLFDPAICVSSFKVYADNTMRCADCGREIGLVYSGGPFTGFFCHERFRKYAGAIKNRLDKLGLQADVCQQELNYRLVLSEHKDELCRINTAVYDISEDSGDRAQTTDIMEEE